MWELVPDPQKSQKSQTQRVKKKNQPTLYSFRINNGGIERKENISESLSLIPGLVIFARQSRWSRHFSMLILNETEKTVSGYLAETFFFLNWSCWRNQLQPVRRWLSKNWDSPINKNFFLWLIINVECLLVKGWFSGPLQIPNSRIIFFLCI